MFDNCIEAENEFEKCWQNPAYTQIKLDDVDVNQVLSHYTTDKPVHFNQEMLWDMEIKKAWNPGHYIPYVVREGSAKAWGKHQCLSTKGVIFVRSSWQKQWLNPNFYEEVYEEVYVNSDEQRITFIGVTVLKGHPGKLVPSQPLFHVQHSVVGSKDHPLNRWRIVHLTKRKDEYLIESFKALNDPTMLPGFIQIYIEKDLGVSLRHK
jgi:hypothetical protein